MNDELKYVSYDSKIVKEKGVSQRQPYLSEVDIVCMPNGLPPESKATQYFATTRIIPLKRKHVERMINRLKREISKLNTGINNLENIKNSLDN